jgi:hypothetical protein
MGFSKKIAPVIFATLVCVCSSWANTPKWQGLEGIPLHESPSGVTKRPDLSLLSGPRNFISGEYFIWDYKFPWNGSGDDKKTYPLNEGALVRYIYSDAKIIKIKTEEGVIVSTLVPPYISSKGVFKFATVPVVGTEDYIIKNRLGEPTKIQKCSDDTQVWTYQNSVSENRDVVENQVANTSGRLTDNSSGATADYNQQTVTQVHHHENIQFSNYNFDITFTKGIVTKVDDHWTSSNWIRDN